MEHEVLVQLKADSQKMRRMIPARTLMDEDGNLFIQGQQGEETALVTTPDIMSMISKLRELAEAMDEVIQAERSRKMNAEGGG